jgi:two-component system, NtrC family, nitrogen regulation sensor histidine kinase NtrY
MFQKINFTIANWPLQRKVVWLICTISVITPMVLVSFLAYVYYYLGIESLFSSRMKGAFDETMEISQLYIDEHTNKIKDDILLLANELNRNFRKIVRMSKISDENMMEIFLEQQTNKLSLSCAVIFQRNTIIAKSFLNFSFILDFDNVSRDSLQKADDGIYVEKLLERNKVRAIMRLDPYFRDIPGTEIYLMVERDIDPKISQHLIDIKKSADVYNDVSINIREIRSQVILIYLATVGGLLVLAVVLSSRFARLITHPINHLVEATTRIKAGDYSARVPEKHGSDEASILSKAFNKMIKTISEQHKNLTKANQQIEERRNLIEVVLAELSAGVLTLDNHGKIILYNNSAIQLLRKSGLLRGDINRIDSKIQNRHYSAVFPELKKVVAPFLETGEELIVHDVHNMYSQEGYIKSNLEVGTVDQKRQFFVHSGAVFAENGSLSTIVITFDDVTELVDAQRFIAWVDIAKRIAHEIKNPLTPIQLIVERLQKKFADQIHQDKNQFDKYLQTIERRVQDMRRMINEFVEFARLSQPQIASYDLCEIIKEVILLQQSNYPNINYVFTPEENQCFVKCDNMQIMQVLTNLCKNAAESLLISSTDKKFIGEVVISIDKNNSEDFVTVKVADNGGGIGTDILNQACEPYITTKKEGMGLGLSIVRRIIDEHHGKFSIQNNPNGLGVVVIFTVPGGSKK